MDPEETAKELYEETPPDEPRGGFFRKVKGFTGKFIQWDVALCSSALMATWAFLANCDHGLDEGLYAALKQFPVSLLVGGLIYKGANRIAGAFESALEAYSAVALYEVGITTSFYCYHHFTGTPDSLETTVVPPLIAAPFIIKTAYSARRKYREQF